MKTNKKKSSLLLLVLTVFVYTQSNSKITEGWHPEMPETKKSAREKVKSLDEEVKKQEKELSKMEDNSPEYNELEEKLIENRIDLKSAEIAELYLTNPENKNAQDAFEARKKALQDPKEVAKLRTAELIQLAGDIAAITNETNGTDTDNQQTELSTLDKLKLQVRAFFQEKQAQVYKFFNDKEQLGRTVRNLTEIYTALRDPESIQLLVEAYGMNLSTLAFLLKQDSAALERIAKDPEGAMTTAEGNKRLADLLVDLMRLRQYAKDKPEQDQRIRDHNKKIRAWIDDTLEEFRTTFSLDKETEAKITATIDRPTIFQVNFSTTTPFENIISSIKQVIRNNTNAITIREDYPERSITTYVDSLEQLAQSIQDFAHNPGRNLTVANQLELNQSTRNIYETLSKVAQKQIDVLTEVKKKRGLTKVEGKLLDTWESQREWYAENILTDNQISDLTIQRVLERRAAVKLAEGQRATFEKRYEEAPKLSIASQENLRRIILASERSITNALQQQQAGINIGGLQKQITDFIELIDGYRTLVAHMPTTDQDIRQLNADILLNVITVLQARHDVLGLELPPEIQKIIATTYAPLEQALKKLDALATYHINQLTPITLDTDGQEIIIELDKTIIDHSYANTAKKTEQSTDLNSSMVALRQSTADALRKNPGALTDGNTKTLLGQQLSSITRNEVQTILGLPLIKQPTQLLKNVPVIQTEE